MMASLCNGNSLYFRSSYFDCRGAFDHVLLCNELNQEFIIINIYIYIMNSIVDNRA